MKKLFLIGAVLLLAACQQTEIADVETTSNNVEPSKSSNVSAIENYISQTKGSKTRSGNQDLIPYIIKGDTVMFVANYENGGFEIFSNDARLPMVLVKSQTGFFIPNNPADNSPFAAYISDSADCLQKIGVDSSAEPTGLWDVYSTSKPKKIKGSNSNALEYKLVGIATEKTEKVWTPKGGRLSTKWNQGSYYNQCVPYYTDGSGIHAYGGCGAVAVGQYVFHSHKFFNLPETTVTDAVYDASSNTYSFSGSSSTVWNQMNDGSDPSMLKDLQKMLPTSVFLGYVAKRLNSSFGLNYGDGTSTKIISYINFIHETCGKDLYEFNFDFVTTRDILASGFPVLAVSSGLEIYNGSSKPTAHAYLIDYAQLNTSTYYDVYAYVINNGEFDEGESEDSENTDLDYYKDKYGDIFTEYNSTYSESWISMNWGWGGKYDDLLINADLSEWIINRGSDSLHFDWNTIFINF